MSISMKALQLAKQLPDNHIVHKAPDYFMERISGRTIFIYGCTDAAAQMANFLEAIDVSVKSFIDDSYSENIFCGTNVIQTVDLLYEDKDKIFIIVANPEEKFTFSKEKLTGFGFIWDVHFTEYIKPRPYSVEYHFDFLLSANRVMDTLEGFELLGTDEDAKAGYRIVLLGGSTTERVLNSIPSWCYPLQEQFKERNIPVQIYCGGVCEYNSSQELLKLIRDVLPLKPDIIISYSGFNDLSHWCDPQKGLWKKYKKPFLTAFQHRRLSALYSRFPDTRRIFYAGLPNDKTCAEFWLDNTRSMHALAQEFGISFLSFLQPFYYSGAYVTTENQAIVFSRHWPDRKTEEIRERRLCYEKHLAEMKHAIQGFDYIHDLTGIFDNETDIFRGICHVTEKGNKVVAESIFPIVMARCIEKNAGKSRQGRM